MDAVSRPSEPLQAKVASASTGKPPQPHGAPQIIASFPVQKRGWSGSPAEHKTNGIPPYTHIVRGSPLWGYFISGRDGTGALRLENTFVVVVSRNTLLVEGLHPPTPPHWRLCRIHIIHGLRPGPVRFLILIIKPARHTSAHVTLSLNGKAPKDQRSTRGQR